MKRGLFGVSLLAIFLSVLLINFVSAQFYSGNFLGFISFEDILVFGSIFLIFFLFIFFSLSRLGVFSDAYGNINKGVVAVISFAITFLIIYFGFYRTGFDVPDLASGIGVSLDSIYPILLIVFLILGIFMFIFLRWLTLVILGLFILGVTLLTDAVYEVGIALLIGALLVVVGLLLWWRRRQKSKLTHGRTLGGITSQIPYVITGALLGALLGLILGKSIAGAVIGFIVGNILGLLLWGILKKK